MNYYISDLNIGYEPAFNKNKIEIGEKFKTIEDYNQEVIKNWNNNVSKKDKVYIIGNLTIYTGEKLKNLLSELNGKKILICGDKDRFLNNKNSSLYFEEICTYKKIIDKGIPVILNDFPLLFYENQYENAVHLYGNLGYSVEERLFQISAKNLEVQYGIPTNAYNVGCMMPYMNYTPRRLEEIICNHLSY